MLQSVVELAPYFDYHPDVLEKSGRANTMVRDGAAYIHEHKCGNKKYDFVLMDAYDERDLLPDALIRSEVLDSLRNECFDDDQDRAGWFIVNLVNLDLSVFESYIKDIARRFEHLYIVQTKLLNRLLIAQTKGPIMTHLQLIQQTELQMKACPLMPSLTRGRGYFQHIDPIRDPLWLENFVNRRLPYRPTNERRMGLFFG